MRSIFGLTVVIVVMATCGSAAAEWISQKGPDNPFKGGSEVVAIKVDGSGFSFGFRCTKASGPVAIFIVPERPRADHEDKLAFVSSKLVAIVDDRERVELDAELQVTPDRRQYRLEVTSPEATDLFFSIGTAKRRLALAAEINGDLIWSHVFATAGAAKVLALLKKNCEIEPNSPAVANTPTGGAERDETKNKSQKSTTSVSKGNCIWDPLINEQRCGLATD